MEPRDLRFVIAHQVAKLHQGRSITTVMSGRSASMSPTIRPGQTLTVEPVSVDALRVGDIIAYRTSDQTSYMTVHRVVAIERYPELAVHTKGDNNGYVDGYTVTAGMLLGRVQVVH